MITQDDQIIFRCRKNYQKNFNKDSINRYANTYEFCNKDINRSFLLLKKRIYPYEYIDSWERFYETSLPDKEAFYSSLNMEGILSVDYRHAKRVYKEFKLENVGDYHDLYIQSDTLLLTDVFENFRNKCIETYELDSDHLLSAPRIKTGLKLQLLTHIGMSLIFEKGIRGGMCHAIHRYAEPSNK